MKLAIGIDTGGTYTDAVLYDAGSGKVISEGKSLTTYDDLRRGILESLDKLDKDLIRDAKTASLSTTLATNACVEGKLRRSRLLLMGIDRKGMAKYGAEYGFTDPDDIRYLPCRTTVTGRIDKEPDWEYLRENAAGWFSDVQSCAVCEIYGVRNGGVLEKKAAEIIEEETGLPVVCASALSGELSSLERAASAVLNAGLLPITEDFMESVKDAFAQRGIHAKIFVVRSNSCLMNLDYSYSHAIETVASGPAASSLGGSILAGADTALIVDMGGTTTDISIVKGGTPVMSDDGVRIGKWRTAVKGLFSSSFALGGDSAIRWDSARKLVIGPNRILPLCLLAQKYPQTLEILRKQVEEVPSHSRMLHEFLVLNCRNYETAELTEKEKKLCAVLTDGPMILRQAAEAAGLDAYQLGTENLEKNDIIIRAGLTPTDIMHVKKDYLMHNRDASIAAARFAAASMKVSLDRFCDLVYDKISEMMYRNIASVLLQYQSLYFNRHGYGEDIEKLLDLQWATRHRADILLDSGFRTPAKIVGVGGPVHIFLPEAVTALKAAYLIPQHAPVANAVGAVTGKISASLKAEIRPHSLVLEDGTPADFEVLCEGMPPQYFTGEHNAVKWTLDTLHALTGKNLLEQGTEGTPLFKDNLEDVNAESDFGALWLGKQVEVTAFSDISF